MENLALLDFIGLVAIVVLVLANGFFVAAEFSLVSVRRTRIAELVESGDVSAQAVQEAIDNPDQVIAATQLGITLASLGLGWVGEPALSHLIEPIVSFFPGAIHSEVSHSISAAISFTIITFLHVVVGELAPKSIALQDPERTSLVVAKPTLWSEFIFKPAIWLLNGTGNALLRLLGVEPASGHELVHSVEEIRMLVSASAESGVVMADESEMLKAIFDFRNLLVRQVMIPRTEMVVVEAETPLEDIICLVSESTFTKFPVFEDDLDNIIGIVHFKDLLNIMQSEAWEMTTARKLAREPIFVPETATVSGLLSHLRASRQHIAIIMDEFGGTAGLVTLEDLLEEIVGEISDPFDIVVPEFQHLPDGSTLVDGRIMIEDVNEQLGLELNDPHYDTIAGYVLGKLGRIPKPDDIVEGDGVHIRVHEMDGMRISRIELTILGAPDQMELPAQKKDND